MSSSCSKKITFSPPKFLTNYEPDDLLQEEPTSEKKVIQYGGFYFNTAEDIPKPCKTGKLKLTKKQEKALESGRKIAKELKEYTEN